MVSHKGVYTIITFSPNYIIKYKMVLENSRIFDYNINMKGVMNMETYTVSFFGHREIRVSDMTQIAEALSCEIRELLLTREYVRFLVGRSGDFDYFAAAAVHRVREEHNYVNCSLVLVLPYITKEYRYNKKVFQCYYDDIEICGGSETARFKGAYQNRNRMMIDRSDMVISCIEHRSGSVYHSLRYAKKQNKKVINLADQITKQVN